MTPQAEDDRPHSLGIAALGDQEDVTLATRRNVNGFLDPFSIDKTAQEHLHLGDGITTLKDPGALFKLHPEPGAKYLIETDPAFTDKKRFLSSDYMLEQLKWDPDKMQKRLGDGFYERRLIIDQILQRTGSILPDGYEDVDAAIKALMDAGIAAAKDLQIAPGIALSKEQIAKLKSDIIWIEEQEVEVGGIREKVLVPHVYFTSTKGLTLSPDGSIISARSIDIQTQEDVHNAGLILGKEDLRVDAKNFANEGDIYAGTAVVKTSGDIRQNGSITAERKAELIAGGSISSENNIEHFAHQDVVRRMADISVTGDDGTLTLDAQKDIDLKGATLSAGGKNAAVIVNAGENIHLTTDTLSADKDMTQSGDNYLRTKRSTELGTTIKASGDVSLHAGENIEARAAYIRSDEGNVSLNAGNDISLTAGREISDDAYGIKYKSQGLLSSTTTTVRSRRESDHAIGTTISGKNVDIAADNDIELRAANIAADENAAVRAKGTVSLTPEARRDITENYKSVKKSGIMGQGFGVFIGTKKTTDTYEGDALTRQGTTIAATGSISISADQDAHLTNAALYAGKDAAITAAGVKLDGKDNIIKEKYTHEVSQSGLSISLGGAVMDTYNDIARPVRRIGAVRDDRLRGLYAWEIGRKLYDLTKKPADGIARYKELLKGKNAFGLNIGLGSSRSSSMTEILSHENTGSKIEAGTDLSLRAREKDISMTGGSLQGKNVTLEAKKNIDLHAAENTTHTVTKERSRSAGISVTYTFGAGITSVGINAERAASDGIGERTTYTPALVEAKEKLSMTSGADTDIIGSQASGKKVDMKVGGNLNIESLQEKDDYREKNSSSGFNISASMSGGINTNDPDIAASYSKGKIHSNWKSATGQAGIYAGADGFHIHVEKNTDLKGAVIASEAASDKNTLSTGTLTYGNIENSASYSASSKGLSYRKFASGAYGAGEGYNMKGLTPVLSVPAQGDAASTTKSAIAPGNIDVRENPNQDLSDLNRNTSNALNELGRIFDKKKIEEQQELAAVFGEEAYRLAHNLKDDGSGRKILVHAAIGGIMSSITGAGFTSGAVGAGLNEAVIKEIAKIPDPGTAQIVSAIVGAAAAKAVGGTAGAGASAAASGTKWNFFRVAQHHRNSNGSVISMTDEPMIQAAENILIKEDGSKISSDEATQVLYDLAALLETLEPEKSTNTLPLVEKFSSIVRLGEYLHAHGYTQESADRFLNQYTKEINAFADNFIYKKLGSDSGVVFSKTLSQLQIIKKDFQLPNYIYDRTSEQSKKDVNIYGWKYLDDIRVAVNKDGNIYLDADQKPVLWEADMVAHPVHTIVLKNKIEMAILSRISSPLENKNFLTDADLELSEISDPANFTGAGRVAHIGGKLVQGLSKEVGETLIKSSLNKSTVYLIRQKAEVALRDFKSKTWDLGNQAILLNKEGMMHILTRHHPSYWLGTLKKHQTFFSTKSSINDIIYTIQKVVYQNKENIINGNLLKDGKPLDKAKETRFLTGQIEAVIDGVKYVVGLEGGHINQFFIKER